MICDLLKLNIHPLSKEKRSRFKASTYSLATDTLVHASHRNYETAILVAGDEDYIPLVKAVKNEGCRVLGFPGFLDNGLSPKLKQSSSLLF